MKITIDTDTSELPEEGTELEKFGILTYALRAWEADDGAPSFVRGPSVRLMDLIEIVEERGSVVEVRAPGRWMEVAEDFVIAIGTYLGDGGDIGPDAERASAARVQVALCDLTMYLLEVQQAEALLEVPGPKGPAS